MAIPWGLIVFVVGIVYGYMKKGRQDKSDIFKTGVIWGLIIAVIFAVIGLLTDAPAAGVGEGFLGFVISFVILTLLFVLGVWLGDWIEHRKQPGGA